MQNLERRKKTLQKEIDFAFNELFPIQAHDDKEPKELKLKSSSMWQFNEIDIVDLMSRMFLKENHWARRSIKLMKYALEQTKTK